MLAITPEALTVIRRVSTHPRMEPTAGLRVAARPDSSAPLEVKIVDRPRPGDSVVERHGTRLYLDLEAAERVQGGELDAVTDRRGRVQFVLRDAA
jgi:Fe-S cluster assembly iron-binding protein IscA